MLPHLAVLPSRDQYPGANTLEDPSPRLDLVPFEEALRTEWGTHAHFVQYVVAVGDDSIDFPRINKPCLPEIEKSGANVWVTVWGIDIDTPGHAELDVTLLEFLESQLINAMQAAPLLASWAAYYSTRSGLRLVYVLHEPLAPDRSEYLQNQFLGMFRRAGVQVDEACWEWNRAYGLPLGTRDGTPLGKREFDVLELQPEEALDTTQIPIFDPEPVKRDRTAYVRSYDGDLPDDTIYAELCVELSEKGEEKPSKWFKEAKRRLKGRDCFNCLFKGDALAQRGSRDRTLQKYVGELCSLLVRQPKTTPEHLYALFLPSLNQLEQDEPWREKCWKAICKYWPRELKKEEIEKEQKQEVYEANWKSLLAGLQSWNRDPRLFGDESAAKEWVHRHAILAAKTQYFLLKPDGKYDTIPVDRPHLIARIRELGMDEVVPTWSMGPQGGVTDKSIQGMLNQYVSTGYEIDGMVDGRDGIVIGKRILRTLFRRTPDVAPLYDARVDQWLRVLAGDEYERLCKWISFALAWDEGPICALSLSGPPNAGKKMLVQGLVECVDTGKASDTKEFSRFKHGVMQSPFLIINEGFPDARFMENSPADTFRAFVGGDPIRVEEKHQVPITVRNPLRIVITTNNDDVVRVLSGGRDLTEYDREAIAQRIYHFDITKESPRWLERMGGMDYTRGWITGDSGTESDRVVAGHFMHLYSQRSQYQRGKRFLMDGTNNERLVKAMTLRSGGAPIVFEILTRQIEAQVSQEWSAVVEDGRVFVTEAQIEQYDRDFNKAGRKSLSLHVIRNVLAAMRAPGSKPETCVKGEGRKKRLATWHELNLKLMLDEAIERGLPCAKLQRLVGYGELPTIVDGSNASLAPTRRTT